MALNRFMHPRNIYKTPPNFKELAISYPEFRKFAKQDLSGKVTLDFKNAGAVRALTQTLLLRDFSLNVEIPADRLVPTLPLRLNYLLWIEDLLGAPNALYNNSISGIDIGTGASCIYPLLAAKRNSWHMFATEVDTASVQCAQNNVNNNKLQHLITVSAVPKEVVLAGSLGEGRDCAFCMCNPPFFSSEAELEPKAKARCASRPLPRNAHSGTAGELVAPGGEVSFIKRILEESGRLRERIRIYSVMVGHKANLAALAREAHSVGASSVATTEFCQGRTTRWGLAWSFVPGLQLASPTKTAFPTKPKAPLSYTIHGSTFTQCVKRVTTLLRDLKMELQEVKRTASVCGLLLTATENTWSNQRRKRRDAKKNEASAATLSFFDSSINKPSCSSNETKVTSIARDSEYYVSLGSTCDTANEKALTNGPSREDTHANKQNEDFTETDSRASSAMSRDTFAASGLSSSVCCNSTVIRNYNCVKVFAEPVPTELEVLQTDGDCLSASGEKCVKRLHTGDDIERDYQAVKKPRLEIHELSEPRVPILEASLVMRNMPSSLMVSEVQIELSLVQGSGDRDVLHQVLQYLKNKLK